MTPEAVKAATDNYITAEDAFGRWMEECCTQEEQAHEAQAKLFTSWSGWASCNNEFVGPSKRFSQQLIDRGFVPKRVGTRAGFLGIKVAPLPF